MSRVPNLESEDLIERLKNLHEGPLVLPDVIRLGPAAVPGLESILRGPSQAVPHSRCLAADALGAIGGPVAAAALVRALRDSVTRTLDFVSFEAERVVVDRIADHLSAYRDAEVIEALLDALRLHPYPACARALGRLKDPRAIPLLNECLHDDAARPAAVDALRQFGHDACAPLIRTLIEPRIRQGPEAPSSIDARVAAARLLGGLVQTAVAPAVEIALHAALGDRQRTVRIEAAMALAQCGGKAAPEAAMLLAIGLDQADWAQAERMMNTLALLGSVAEKIVAPLIAGPTDDEASRRRIARAAIVAGRIDAPSAVAPLAALARAGDRRLRLTAITALGRIHTATRSALERFLLDREALIRRRAVRALRERRALDLALAIELLGDPDREIRRLARASLLAGASAAQSPLARALLTLGSRPRMASLGTPQQVGAPLPRHGWIERVRSRARLWSHAWECLISAWRHSHPGRGWT